MARNPEQQPPFPQFSDCSVLGVWCAWGCWYKKMIGRIENANLEPEKTKYLVGEVEKEALEAGCKKFIIPGVE